MNCSPRSVAEREIILLARVNVYVYCSCNFSLYYSDSYSCLFARGVRSVYNREELAGCLHCWFFVSLSLSSHTFSNFNSLQTPLLQSAHLLAFRLIYYKALISQSSGSFIAKRTIIQPSGSFIANEYNYFLFRTQFRNKLMEVTRSTNWWNKAKNYKLLQRRHSRVRACGPGLGNWIASLHTCAC